MLKNIISVLILVGIFAAAVTLCIRSERKRREALNSFLSEMDIDETDFDIPYWEYVGRDVEEDEI